ncbi:MAG: FGGY family carbohydrate kinase, partial [Monoglobales bacterium]
MNLLGIDVGTTSVKAALFDREGNMLESAAYDYTLITDGDRVEFDAEKYVEIVKTAINDMRKNHDVYALAIDTQCETLIVTDGEGNPLRNAIVWLDNRASAEADEIKEKFGLRHVYEITGQPEITATWPASKLIWMRKNEPDIFKKTKKIFLLEDWLIYRLTGEFVTEKTLQSSSLYFDINTGKWWDEMLIFAGISEDMLPALKDSCQLVGEYEGIKVVTSAMDQVAAAIGAGVYREGMVSEMTGTAMVLFAPCKNIPPYNENSIIPCHYNFDGSYAQLLWTQTAGMTLKWFKNNLCENFSFRQLDELAENVPVGSAGLTMLPHLSGSTMPKYNPSARGYFCGMTLEHTR